MRLVMLRTIARPEHIALAAFVIAMTAPAAAQSPDRSARPALGPVPELSLTPPVTATLSNGLKIVVLERHQVPLVQIDVRVRAGSLHDDPARPGLATLTAEMLDEGAGGWSALALADAFEQLGARFATGAGRHMASASLRIPVGQIGPALEFLAHVVLRPDFPAAELERLRAERLTALIRRHDDPNTIADVQFDRIVFGENHPYGRPALGTEAAIRSFDVAALRAFHERFYRPGNTTIYVTGAIAAEDAMRLLRTAFGDWSAGVTPQATPAPPAQTVRARTVYLVDKPGAVQSVIAVGHAGVPRDDPDYAALEVMNTILGGSFTSRLNQNLREDKGYAYGARSAFDYGIGAGAFSAGAAVQAQSTGPALVEFLNELEAIRQPIPQEEIDRARNYLAMRFIQGFQSVAQIGAQLAGLGEYQLPPDALTTYVDRVLAVTKADVERVARTRIDPANLAIVIVGDRATIEAQIRAVHSGPLHVLKVVDVLGPVPATGPPTD